MIKGSALVKFQKDIVMKLYVYSLEDNRHIATITSNDNAACEARANDVYGGNDCGWTYSPAFGFANGLVENGDAVQLEV
jgi:hypothetical protein